MAICYACSQYQLRSAFSDTQWKRPRQKDGNVPRTCNACLKMGSVDDILNWDMVGERDAGDTLDFERRPPRPEKFRSERNLDSLLDRAPDRDSGQSVSARNAELEVMWQARGNRREKKKRKRGEGGDN